MPRIDLAAADMPLGARLRSGLGYPLRGGALAACAILAIVRYVILLPGLLGVLAELVLWIVTWLYAIDCLMHTADGYRDPPDLGIEGRAANARGILGLQILAMLVLYLVALYAHAWLWLALIAAAVLLPAMDMSLAFDGDILVALNPITWASAVTRFGIAYLVPVAANVALALLLGLAGAGSGWLPAVLGIPVFGFVYTFLIVLDFHWMGLLVWHYRERLGMQPEAPELAKRTGQDADDVLVRECELLARSDPEEAAIRLRDRIRERAAPASVHTSFRRLLRQLGRDDLLLGHGQTWIAQLCAAGEARRALGVVQECREIDPGFVPDDPSNAVALADLAARMAMHGLAKHLADAFVQRWPTHQDAARIAALGANGP